MLKDSNGFSQEFLRNKKEILKLLRIPKDYSKDFHGILTILLGMSKKFEGILLRGSKA